jgi:hypothetical protein
MQIAKLFFYARNLRGNSGVTFKSNLQDINPPILSDSLLKQARKQAPFGVRWF